MKLTRLAAAPGRMRQGAAAWPRGLGSGATASRSLSPVFDGRRSRSEAPHVTRPAFVVSALVLAVAVGGWVVVNPGGQFGISRHGVTTFNRMPVPFLDLQVRDDGAVRLRWKSHDINAKGLEW